MYKIIGEGVGVANVIEPTDEKTARKVWKELCMWFWPEGYDAYTNRESSFTLKIGTKFTLVEC